MDLTQIRLHRRLNRLRHLVEDVGRFVDPTPLVGRSGEDLIQGSPEAESAVADRDLGRDGGPRRFTSTSNSRQLWALSRTRPGSRRAPSDPRASRRSARVCTRSAPPSASAGRRRRPRRRLSGEPRGPALPAGILVCPGRGQPGDDGRREVRGVTPQQGCQRFLEVAGRDAAQVQHRQQRIQAAGAPRPLRQERRGEPNPVLRPARAAISDASACEWQMSPTAGRCRWAASSAPPGSARRTCNRASQPTILPLARSRTAAK